MQTQRTAALLTALLLVTAGIGGFAFAQQEDEPAETNGDRPEQAADTGESQRRPSSDARINVYYLSDASADTIAPILKQLFPEFGIATDRGENALFIKGAEPAELDEIEAAITKLEKLFRERPEAKRGDDAEKSRSSARNPFRFRQSPRQPVENLKHANCVLCHSEPGKSAGTLAGLDRAEYRRLQEALHCTAVVGPEEMMMLEFYTDMGRGGPMMLSRRPEPAIDAKERYTILEQAAAKLAARQQPDTYGMDEMYGAVMGEAPPPTKEQQQLRRLVTAAFEARQAMQREEVEQFRQRLANIEQSIAAREALRDKIIDRRVQELLNPELRWESAPIDPAKPAERRPTPGRPRPRPPVPGMEGGYFDDEYGGAAGLRAPSTPRRDSEAGAVRPPQTSGMVLSVDDEKQHVEISLGTKDGMRNGLKLSVVRDNEYLGRLAVIRIRESSATARIEKSQADKPIRPGDRIRPEREPEPARRQSAENLKALTAALRKYHDQHGRFPPAVIQRTFDGKTVPHSWRVAILPFLGEQALYDQYKFDEPWDSKHNRALLEKMPAVFRSPVDAPDSTNASYFALVTPSYTPPAGGAVLDGAGAMGDYQAGLGLGIGRIRGPARKPSYRLGTVFSNPDGTQIRNITDGLSNTIALVEARRNIPWTRPHDIPYILQDDQPLPVLGGWFPEGWHAGFADGAAKFLSYENDEATLRALFTIGGGEPVTPKLVDEMALGRVDGGIESDVSQTPASQRQVPGAVDE